MGKKNKPKNKAKNVAKTPSQGNQPNGLVSFWQRKKPIIIYGLGFIVFILLFSWIGSLDSFDRLAQPLLGFYTQISAVVLSIFGLGISASGDILGNSDFSIQVKKGCDAIAPMALYIIATLAFPVAMKLKLRGIALGLAALFVLNVIRIASLWLIGRYAPDLFDFAHVELWQVLFIAITVVLWLYWLRWAFAQSKTTSHGDQLTA